MRKIELHPEIFLVEDFLSSQECAKYIEFSEMKAFEEAKISINGSQIMNKGIRNNDRVLFFDTYLANKLWEKVKPFVQPEMGLYSACGLNEMFRVYRYSEGQRFKMHRDGSFERNEKECSFFSFLIYLNDDFTGGETVFRNITTVKPKKGSALIFHHPLRHEGKIIESGIKYVLRSDIMYKLNETK